VLFKIASFYVYFHTFLALTPVPTKQLPPKIVRFTHHIQAIKFS